MSTWRAGCGGSRTSGSEGGPEKPTVRKIGRALRSDPYTIIKLIDGTKAYLHAVIDNFRRRILAWRVAEHLEIGSTVAILRQAARRAVSADTVPTFVSDAGVENVDADVDGLVGSGLLSRVLALKDVMFSNSMIEAWWRTLKYQWLFPNHLDSVETVRRLAACHVTAHNTEIPHAAFRGQTPDEIYYAWGDHIPEQPEAAKALARATRLKANRGLSCTICDPGGGGTLAETPVAA